MYSASWPSARLLPPETSRLTSAWALILATSCLADSDIHGEGINVAVRLEELAPPGGLCLSHSLYLQTRHALADESAADRRTAVEEYRRAGPRLAVGAAERRAPPGAMHGRKARPASGRQILDPNVTALLVDLTCARRSSLCRRRSTTCCCAPTAGAACRCRTSTGILPASSTTPASCCIPFSIERGDSARAKGWRAPLSMTDFIAQALDGGDIFFAAELIKRIQSNPAVG